MPIYFLLDESKVFDSLQKYDNEVAGRRFFNELGSFTKAAKEFCPELVFAEKGLFGGGTFDLREFLSEQGIQTDVFYISFSEEQNSIDILNIIRTRHRLSEKNFWLLEYLYLKGEATPLQEIIHKARARGFEFSEDGIRVALSRLRSSLKEDRDYNISFIKERAGYRIFFTKKTSV